MVVIVRQTVKIHFGVTLVKLLEKAGTKLQDKYQLSHRQLKVANEYFQRNKLTREDFKHERIKIRTITKY